MTNDPKKLFFKKDSDIRQNDKTHCQLSIFNCQLFHLSKKLQKDNTNYSG